MIQLEAIEVSGSSSAGLFRGVLSLSPGLQVISARNAYGKSLAVKAVAWCLGIEPIFGLQDNDTACFSQAAREEFELPDGSTTKVLSSECTIRVLHQDGRRLKLTRPIKGDCKFVWLEEQGVDGHVRKSKLVARRETMHDEHGGLQRFLFDWLKWPRQRVTTFRAYASEIYLENLAPTFYIDQNEGWTNIQALQISRYGQQQIAEISVEYLLGALDAIRSRVSKQESTQRSAMLRDKAREIADRANKTFLKRGWRVDWSGNGTVEEVLARWTAKSLMDVLNHEANVDLMATRTRLNDRAEALRKVITTDPIDAGNISAPAAASQRLIELKQERHRLNVDLNILRTQHEEASSLLASLMHRSQAAADLLRLKSTGVGRLDHMECPTCHRDLDPGTFSLNEQSKESVAAHIEALNRDRDLVRKNVESIEKNLAVTQGALTEVDSRLRDAERALQTVSTAVGSVREQVAEAASNLTSVEREIDRVIETATEISDLQESVKSWIAEARSVSDISSGDGDLRNRRDAFLGALRKYLIALGHSAVKAENANLLVFDEDYVPYLNGRRLRSLGSASDQSRLVAAYSLALAAASQQINGFHPGVVILDEPLQQNPDAEHKELFLAFLSQQLARDAAFQTILFTWLSQDEIERLRSQGTKVLTPDGHNFLQLIPASEREIRST